MSNQFLPTYRSHGSLKVCTRVLTCARTGGWMHCATIMVARTMKGERLGTELFGGNSNNCFEKPFARDIAMGPGWIISRMTVGIDLCGNSKNFYAICLAIQRIRVGLNIAYRCAFRRTLFRGRFVWMFSLVVFREFVGIIEYIEWGDGMVSLFTRTRMR